MLIARKSASRLQVDSLPERTTICVVAIGELHAGALAAADTATRARRLSTLGAASVVEALPVTAT